MTQKEIIFKLNEITSDYNFIYIIAGFAFKDFCGPIEDLSKTDSHNQFNYNEASFLIGLWIKNSKVLIKNKFNYVEKIRELYILMEKLHDTFITEAPQIDLGSQSVAEFILNSHSLKEAFFYSSTGAYDFQYVEKASQKYKYDEYWILKNKGFSIKSLNGFYKNIKDIFHEKLNNPKNKNRRINSESDLLNLFTLSYQEITKNNIEYQNITLSFSIEIENESNLLLNNIGDFNEYQTKPIIKLEDDKYFIPIPFYLAEAIYESPFYWMADDEKYRAESLKHRGDVSEEIVHDLISKIFGESNTFKNVKIKKNKTLTISDIDVCGIFNDTAIIFQIKSKKLTSVSKQGNIDKIIDDFKKSIEDAFLQGIECQRSIRLSNQLSFTIDNDVEIKNLFSNIKYTYIVCVVLDVYPALTHQSHLFLYGKYKESTICFSIFDLEVICRYLQTPEKLVDYFSKRIINCRHHYSENELCFLGFYLDHDLKKYDKFTSVMIDNCYGGKIDRMYYPEISGYKVKKELIKIPGRNEKCPCGSNLKYKYCHGK